MVPRKSTVEEVSFEWSHHRINFHQQTQKLEQHCMSL